MLFDCVWLLAQFGHLLSSVVKFHERLKMGTGMIQAYTPTLEQPNGRHIVGIFSALQIFKRACAQ